MSWPTPNPAHQCHGPQCRTCRQELDPDRLPYRGASICSSCDYRWRDDLAYLFGTGRWGQ